MLIGGAEIFALKPEWRFPETIGPALVVPFAVFAARRQSFDMLVRAIADEDGALAIAFSKLPLVENGWNPSITIITRIGTRHGWPVWRLSRGTQ